MYWGINDLWCETLATIYQIVRGINQLVTPIRIAWFMRDAKHWKWSLEKKRWFLRKLGATYEDLIAYMDEYCQ